MLKVCFSWFFTLAARFSQRAGQDLSDLTVSVQYTQENLTYLFKTPSPLQICYTLTVIDRVWLIDWSNTITSCLDRVHTELLLSWDDVDHGSAEVRGQRPCRGVQGWVEGPGAKLTGINIWYSPGRSSSVHIHSYFSFLSGAETWLGLWCLLQMFTSLLLDCIVNFWNSTINIYKSCPEYFLLHHEGILGTAQ